MVEKPVYTIVELPREAFENNPLPIPPTMTPFILDRLEKHPDHGALYWMKGGSYPIKGYPRHDVLMDCDDVKKYIRGWLRVCAGNPFFALGFLFKRTRNKWLEVFVSYCRMKLSRHFLTEEWYPRPIKELRRVAFRLFPEEWQQVIIKSICVILHVDMPYRCRVQDILQKVDYEAAEKNPRKEVGRLLTMLAERDHQKDWTKEARFIPIAMLFSPKLTKLVKEFLLSVSNVEMYFDECDLYWYLKNESGAHFSGVGYDLFGWNKELRFKAYEDKYVKQA